MRIERSRWTFKGLFIAFLLLLATQKLIAPVPPSEELKTFLNVSAFLFGVLAGFSITILWQRYDEIRNAIIAEMATLRHLLLFSNKCKKKSVEPFKEAMENYLKKVLSTPIKDNMASEGEFNSLVDSVFGLEPEGDSVVRNRLMAEIYQNVDSLTTQRMKVFVFAKSGMISHLRAIIDFLGLFIVVLLIMLREPGLAGSLFSLTLSLATIAVLFLVRELDDLTLWEGVVFYETAFPVFDALGVPRYHPESAVEKGILPPKGE